MSDEIKRIENFSEGDFACIRCGKVMHFFWNGGELDWRTCCGLSYITEHVRVDLVVREL